MGKMPPDVDRCNLEKHLSTADFEIICFTISSSAIFFFSDQTYRKRLAIATKYRRHFETFYVFKLYHKELFQNFLVYFRFRSGPLPAFCFWRENLKTFVDEM